MMRGRPGFGASLLAIGVAGALGAAGFAGIAAAQRKPESLLPPDFDDPAPAPTPRQSPVPTPRPNPGTVPPGSPVAQPLPSDTDTTPAGSASLPPSPAISNDDLARLPSLEKLENMSSDELDQLLGLRPKSDLPSDAQRTLTRVGVLAVDEGGLPPVALANQPETLVRAALLGTRGPLVSRWGHIMLRRGLASRLAAPLGMDPVEFAALRVGVLNRLGEFALARAVVQDVDSGKWSPTLTQEAMNAYLASGDIIGPCPAMRLQGSQREDGEWQIWQAICNSYAGETARASTQLSRTLSRKVAPRIDVLLARRYAGAVGRSQRGVEIEWDGIDDLNPWRFGLANAVGEPVPEALLEGALAARGGAYYARAGAFLPMLPADQRARFAGRAAREGIMSADAMVDLYAEAYADPATSGDVDTQAAALREAYLADDPAARIAAMQRLWTDGEKLGGGDGYGAKVLTAYAAARVLPIEAHADAAGDLIAAMLAAGLDCNAERWAPMVDEGSLGWALIALARPGSDAVEQSAVEGFFGNDDSDEQRKSAFLVSGLAGLGRIDASEAEALAGDLDVDLARQTRWTSAITGAAQVGNPALVILLAGLGMQGTSWAQMTPLHLYHITAALRQVGLEAEARMIAAEAVARG
jgi:hypothetical protein